MIQDPRFRAGLFFDGIGIEAMLKKSSMPKDTHGRYHPPKGKPSDTRKEESDKELREELKGDEYLSHPNRNTNKKRDKEIPREEQQQDEHGAPMGGSQEFGTVGTLVRVPATDIKQVFVALARYPADVCVTLYLGGPGWEDGLPLKNALRDARRQMEDMRIAEVIDKVLEPAEELIKDADLWQSQPRGLALFLAPDYHAMVVLPYDPGTEVHVHTSFILAPLAPMVSGEEEYFLLTVSKHRAQLYRGKGFALQPVDIPEMPEGMSDVIHYEEKGDSGVFRSASGAGGSSGPVGAGGARGGEGPRGANFHGVGAGKTEDKQNIEIYLREVDKTLRQTVLGKEHAPLLLAGVDYELSIYRGLNTYPNLLTEELRGQYDRTPVSELAEKAYEKIQAHIEEEWRKKVQHHYDHGTAPVTNFPQDVIRAAFEGRIAQLFLTKGVELWGKYSSEPAEPEIHTQEQPGDDCLTNQVVVQTILHGGQAFVEPRERMPVEGEMVAVLRYS
jgi:hypothetical protein